MKYKQLREIAEIIMGQSPESSSYNTQQDGLPFFQGNADFGELYPTERIWCSSPIKIAEKNDILISVRAPIGAVNIASTKCCIGRGLAAIRIENSNERNYVFHLLKAKNKELNLKGTGSTFKAIGKSVLEEINIPDIPQDAQTTSMQIMDNLEYIIRQRKQELLEMDSLVKARFVELTDSAEHRSIKMGDIATYINGYAFKPNDWSEQGKPIIRIQNLNNADAEYNHFDGKIDEKYLVQPEDVLVSWATHLEAYIWHGPDAWLNQHIFKVEFNKMKMNKRYFVLAADNALKIAFRNAHGFKPTMEHIKREDFENAIVNIPDYSTQMRFSNFAAQVDKSKAAVQKSLDETQLLFDSLMQKYFG